MNTLHIYLNHLDYNYQSIRRRLNPETALIAVVKAAAYGSETLPMAKRLEQLGVSSLAVAYAQEGETLRKGGIKIPILVFYPQPEGLEIILANELEPCLYSEAIFKKFSQLLDQNNKMHYPVHIKYNTGLNRVGFPPEKVSWVLEQLENQRVELKSVYSHLAAAEAQNNTLLNQQQIESFLRLRTQHLTTLKTQPIFHLLNSSGVFNYPEYQFDAVRCGIGLHGFANRPEWDQELKSVVELTSKISQIHHVKKGGFVGYDHGWEAAQDTVIATLPIGHADGIGRHFGNHKANVLLHQSWVPIVGNICMDMLMIDVTGVPCKEGDEVSFFGGKQSAAEFAQKGGTISYEVLTGIGSRVKRIVHS